MERQKVRVMVASENAETRSIFEGLVETEKGPIVIGKAENVVKAVTLARNLRPDVVIVDSYLPHNIGLDTIPMSRIGGYDAAQVISEEIPNTRVVLINKAVSEVSRNDHWNSNIPTYFCKESRGACIPFKISELLDSPPDSPLIFARVEANTEKEQRHRILNSLSDKAMALGALGAFGSLFLIILWVAPPGTFFALAGSVAVAMVGVLGKLLCKTIK